MRLLLRIALVSGALAGILLLALLAWSTGNASRLARYYDALLLASTANRDDRVAMNLPANTVR